MEEGYTAGSGEGGGEEMPGARGGVLRTVSVAVVILLLLAPVLWGAEKKPAKPGAKDKCPVCGMFVAKYPDFLAQVVFKDGTVAFFDGAKDMFKYYLNLGRYNPRQKATDIESIYVTDYYSLTPVDGLTAHYVLGSDVYGPMGRELIPFGKVNEAKEFMKDHKGKSLIRFQDVNAAALKGLD